MADAEGSGAGGTGGRGEPRSRMTDGIRQGLGVLSAFKDAIEETIAEARERGDLTPDRAKQAVKAAVARAQEAAEDARERLDLATHRDLELLRAEVAELRARVEALEVRSGPEGGAGAGRMESPPIG